MTTLETCLGVSGSFEGGNGSPRYTLLAGNADKQGISAGCLQWCAGQGTLQTLLDKTLGGAPVADDAWAPVFAMRTMPMKQAVPYAVAQWVDPSSARQDLTPEATALWQGLLQTPQCIAAQQALAGGILTKATAESARFLPESMEASQRALVFFFDLRVQQGGMSKRREDGTWVTPEVIGTEAAAGSAVRAIQMAKAAGRTKVVAAWEEAIGRDPLAKILLHYAYERAILARTEYQWDALSRRGTIACRQGQVHGKWFDFRETLT